ncbi:MAG: glycosyl hydrolase 53 family protein [Melioribacteraceae bacterium]|nr:glycosyl hydrolase 53 family protein [Melioribacteraceae bacterium]
MIKSIAIILVLITVTISAQEYIRGVDLSTVPHIEDLGGRYKLNGQLKEVLDIFKENGANYVRLRIWHTPSNKYTGLDQTLLFAKRIKEKGLKFLLNFHYSDTWADPGSQTKPKMWNSLSFDQLKDSVYEYTKRVMKLLNEKNSLPDMVQIGNEISGGMLWPDGKLYNVPDFEGQKVKFGQLLKEGIRAVKEIAGTNVVKTMIHIPILNGNTGNVTYFYDIIRTQNVEYDVIGLSYYPWWHGNLTQLKNTLNTVASRYSKEIIIVETAYPWTTGYQSDNTNNIVGPATILLPEYPATRAGQKDFIIKLSEIIKETSNKKGIGFFYWEPALISLPGKRGSDWENVATFSFSNQFGEAEALESLSSFGALSSITENDNYHSMPDQYILYQNYPNSFNPETTIKYQIAEVSNVSLKVYDLLGREVAVLVNEIQQPGVYNVKFNMKNVDSYSSLSTFTRHGRASSSLSTSIYFYRLQVGNYSTVRKMVYIK